MYLAQEATGWNVVVGSQCDPHHIAAWLGGGRGRAGGRSVLCTVQEMNAMRISLTDDHECRRPVAVDRERRGGASSSLQVPSWTHCPEVRSPGDCCTP